MQNRHRAELVAHEAEGSLEISTVHQIDADRQTPMAFTLDERDRLFKTCLVHVEQGHRRPIDRAAWSS